MIYAGFIHLKSNYDNMSVMFLVTKNCYLRGLKGVIAISSIVILVNTLVSNKLVLV